MVYSKGSTNLDIHENTFFLQTTEIDIHVFKWFHNIMYARTSL